MERLDLSQRPEHALEESAIHCARYANILHLVKDKVVLDIACGEGYGAALLKKSGAKRVVAVDISSESIETAKNLFAEFGVEYLVGDANTAVDICGSAVFDVVISIETIEHIETPDIFLRSIRETAKDDAIFYISCPNDYWYYPESDQKNPYHVKKYTFEEFKGLTTECLGNNVQWGLGGAVFGFGTVPLDNKLFSHLGRSWMEINTLGTSIGISNTVNEQLAPHNCSYYVGLWNAPQTNFSNSVFAVNMDAYTRMVEELESNVINVLRINQKENQEALKMLREDREILSHELKKVRLISMAMQAENNALRQSIAREKSTISSMQLSISSMTVPYYRYLKLVKMVPQPIKNVIKKFYNFFKG